MTQHRELATAIARKIFDRIERDETLILQNVADEIHDALVVDAARPKLIAKGVAVVDPDSRREPGAAEYLRLMEMYRTEIPRQWWNA